MDNVQSCDSYINTPSSQGCRSYWEIIELAPQMATSGEGLSSEKFFS
jgi:hypothetical protein